ncbi:MAG TPA: SufE family protein, partial [Xanthomonadales bacterium]|nr:SufE family protein [Xanthomonadales bacterium]
MHDPDKAQEEIIQSFAVFSEWLDRYQYLIDLGRKLPSLDQAEKSDEKLLAGCQSRVWLIMEGNTGEIRIRANSDAAIVSGLIALLINVYSGCSAAQILDTQPYF